jgi:hypothetical protein
LSTGKINPDKWVALLYWIGIPFVFVYFCSMFVYPFFIGGWNHAQKIWHIWQALNVGILAFISSLIAFYISRYNAEKQREREFVAAKAFLPNALSELTEYLSCWAEMLCEAWPLTKNVDSSPRVTLKTELPVLQVSINEVLKECIRHGSPDISAHIANILKDLQINNARLKGLPTDFTKSSRIIRNENIKEYMFCLARIQALVNATFNFARDEEGFVRPEVGITEMTTAYLNLNMHVSISDEMNSYTKNRLQRKKT